MSDRWCQRVDWDALRKSVNLYAISRQRNPASSLEQSWISRAGGQRLKPGSDAVTIGASRSRDVSAAEASASAVPRLEARRIGIREMVRAGTRAGGVPRSRE